MGFDGRKRPKQNIKFLLYQHLLWFRTTLEFENFGTLPKTHPNFLTKDEKTAVNVLSKNSLVCQS